MELQEPFTGARIRLSCLPLCWELALSHLPGENWWSSVPEGVNPELYMLLLEDSRVQPQFLGAWPLDGYQSFILINTCMTNPFQVYFQKLPFPGDHRGWDFSPSLCYWKFEGNSLHLLKLRNIDQIRSCPHSFGILFSSSQTFIWE